MVLHWSGVPDYIFLALTSAEDGVRLRRRCRRWDGDFTADVEVDTAR